MDVLPLPEPGRQGYVVREGKRALVVDAPLDTDAVTEFLPGWLEAIAVVETGVPAWRVAGGRPLAEALGAELHGPAGIRGARSLRSGSRIKAFPEAGVVAAPGRGEHDLALIVGELLFVGDLDAAAPTVDAAAASRVAATRRSLASRLPDRAAHGSAGVRAATELARLPAPAAAPLVNAEAVRMTNEGRADMFWADARFRAEAPEVDRAYLDGRAASPWSPTVLDLRAGPGGEPTDAVRLAPERLASEIGRIEASREVVVMADDAGTAEMAAGFLRRLGVNAAWTR